MKALNIVAKWLFILCLPVLLLTASIGVAVNSRWLYENGFEKYDISRNTGIAEAELEEAASGLISYFNSGEEDISLTVIKDGEPFELFNQREAAHLRDVKGLIRLDYRVLLGTLIYAPKNSGRAHNLPEYLEHKCQFPHQSLPLASHNNAPFQSPLN